MDPALRAFLTGLVDYAGLFPPAKLDMAPAVRNYLAYRAGKDRFMLGRFICPAGRLGELGACLGDDLAEPLDLSVILRGDAVGEDLAVLREFEARAPVRAGAFEIRLPPAVVDRAEMAGLGDVPAFLEAGWPEEGFGPVVADIREAREAGRPFNLKIRPGGLDAKAFPPTSAVAAAILAARDGEVPFKATAGLHHPVRRFDAGVDAKMHGFLNLFGGAVLAGVHGLGAADLTAILDEEDPGAFRFEGGVFSWRDFSASAEEVAHWRGALAVSFGSCSFDEPRDDLRAMELMN